MTTISTKSPIPERTGNSTTTSYGRLPVTVILYLFCIAIPIGFQLGPLTMTTLRALLLVLILPLMFRLVSGYYGKVFLTDILFFLHICWTAIALSFNNPSRVVEQIGSVGVEFLGGYMVARAYIRSATDFIHLARVLVIIVLCILPFALYEATTGYPPLIGFLEKLPGIRSVGIIAIDGRIGLERVQAVFSHPIHYGLFCSVSFSLAFVALKGITTTAWRWTSGILIAFSGLLALSSGALLAILLQIGLIAWAATFNRVQSRWWILFGLFVCIYVAIDFLSNRTPLLVFLSYATFSPHTAYWRSIIFEWGMVNVWRSPIFGIGMNDWVRPGFMNSASVDNFWLLTAMRYGFPGLGLLVAGYVWALYRVMRRDFTLDEQLNLIRRAWVFTFLGLSFTLTTVHVWTNVYSFVFFMFGAGMWLILTPAGEARAPRPSDPGPSTDTQRGGVRYSRFTVRTPPPQSRP